MKKWLISLLMLFLLPLSSAFAAEARDITADCKFKVCSTKFKYTQMTDKKFTSYWESNKIKNPYINVTAPKDEKIAALYVCIGGGYLPEGFDVQISDDGKDWFTAVSCKGEYLHTYIELPEPSRYVRFVVTDEKKRTLRINEFYVLSEGDRPDWVQVWEPTHEKADIMFISTHPDDELLFFGGAIPTYAVEQQRKTVVAYFSFSNSTRSSELLNGLWHMGVRNYPVIGTFKDVRSKNIKTAYKNAGGQQKVNEWVVGLYRKYKPEVVVAQETEGEYGHSQHKMLVEAIQNCIPLAANEDEFSELTVAHGTWDVKKLYLHLYPENQIVFDWSVPLVSMNNVPSIELAEEAYDMHKTQAASGFSVRETGTKYDNRVFGLAYTAVGQDVRKDDFLENIYSGVGAYDASAVVRATPKPTEPPHYLSVLPELNEKGFIDEGEFIYSSEAEGLWIYISQTHKVIIERKYDATTPLTWFEAELWGDVENGGVLHTVQNDPEKMGKVRADAMETAEKHDIVFAMNTDYYTYRVNVNASGRNTGVVIRDNRIIYDDPYTQKKVESADYFPNLDMLAFFPDGDMKVYRTYEITAKELVDMGAEAVYSFGPYLMKDGKLSQQAYDANDSTNPRCAIGMVEPGHYVAIMAEGRIKGRSAGLDLTYLAKLMRNKGCDIAYNLDGGQTAVMIFMGKQLNKIGSYDGGKTNSRKTSEVLAFGYSDQVGEYEVSWWKSEEGKK